MSDAIEVRCMSKRLNHVVFDENGANPRRVKEGETFKVGKIPEAWKGLVAPLGQPEDLQPVAVVNPADDEELTALKAEYKEKLGKAAHHTWDAETIRQKLAEEGAE